MSIQAKATMSEPQEREVTLVMGEHTASVLLQLLRGHIAGGSPERYLLCGGPTSIARALQDAGVKPVELRVRARQEFGDAVLQIEGLAL